MLLSGRVWKHKKDWLIEIPALDLMTQGRTRKDALKMIKDAIYQLVHHKNFRIKVQPGKGESFSVKTNDIKYLLALLLKRQRLKHNLSLSDVASHLGVKSKNSYAQYEQGRSEPSLSKMQQLLKAINPHVEFIVALS